MVTDISLLNNVVQITVDFGGTNPQKFSYISTEGKYFFDLAGTTFNLSLYPTRDTYTSSLTNLRVAGATVASVAAALTALSSVFQK